MGEGRGARDKKELSGVSPSLWTSLPLPSEHWVALSVSVLYHDHSALKILILLGWWFKMSLWLFIGEGNGTPLQYSCLENPMDGGAWKAAVHGVAEGRTRLNDFTFTFHFHALEKEMATHCSVLAWRIPGTGKPGGLPSVGSHRVGHDWSDLAIAMIIYGIYSLTLMMMGWTKTEPIDSGRSRLTGVVKIYKGLMIHRGRGSEREKCSIASPCPPGKCILTWPGEPDAAC